MRNRLIFLVTVAALGLSTISVQGWADSKKPEAEWIYVAKKGDNLWNITERYLTGIKYWRPLQRLNKIDRPRQIPPGTHIHIPVKWSKILLANATVKAVHGKVSIESGSAESPVPAVPGLVLSEGDRIRTAHDSSVLLQFADQTELLLISDSDLLLEHLKSFGDGDVADTRIRLEGSTENHANPNKLPSSRFRINTPSAVMAIRGTEFRVRSSRDASNVEVTSGIVSVTNDSGQSAIKAGYGIVAKSGEALEPPVKLLPPPDLKSVPDVIQELNAEVVVGEVQGATGYRVQVAASERFDTLLLNSIQPPGRIYPDFASLPDGPYVLRMRALDVAGLEGEESSRPFTLNARPVAPAYIAPATGLSLTDTQPEFRWARPDGASSYRLQIAQENQPDRLLLDTDGIQSENYRSEKSLGAGAYHWRVQAYDTSGVPGPYGHYQSFRILPEAPTLNTPQIDNDAITLEWSTSTAKSSYQIQISRKSDFSDLVVDEQTEASRYVIQHPEQGEYFMRVSTIDEDGYEGPYSPVQTFYVATQDRWIPLLISIGAFVIIL